MRYFTIATCVMAIGLLGSDMVFAQSRGARPNGNGRTTNHGPRMAAKFSQPKHGPSGGMRQGMNGQGTGSGQEMRNNGQRMGGLGNGNQAIGAFGNGNQAMGG